MDNKAQTTGTAAIIGVVSTLVILIVYFSVIPLLGDRIEQAADISQDTYATGTLTFSGEVADTETVNISTDRYEFDTTGSVTSGNIAVTLLPNASATGTLTFTDNVSDTETVTIDSVVFEFDTEGNTTAGRVAVNISDVLPAIATANLSVAINGNATTGALVTSTSTSTTVVVTADAPGTAGNSIATTDTVTNATFGAVTLEGGSEDLSSTAAAIRFAAAVGTGDTVGVAASRSGDAVTITADAAGTAGNVITTTETVTNAAFGAATLTGGLTTASAWASDDITTASDLWEDNGSMIAVAMVIVIVGVILLVLRGAF